MAQTHDLAAGDGVLVKRYTSWYRDEHRREWTMLNYLYDHVPDLVPAPLGAQLDGIPPSVTVSQLVGQPLDGALTQAQLDGLEVALRRMWSVPASGLPQRRYYSWEAVAAASSMCASATRPDGIAGEVFGAVVSFLRQPAWAGTAEVVVGHGDPNLTNYLWDGQRIRIVDFEDAGSSDVAYELATLVEHLSAHPTDWTEFLSRFEVDGDQLRWARCLWASLWFCWLLPGNGAAKRNPPGTLQRQAERLLKLLG